MKSIRPCIAAVALCVAAVPAAAESLAGSSASSASAGSSASIGSVSDSFQGSSDSSRGGRTAAGDWRVIEVAALAERPGTARLTLQALAEGEPRTLTLDLPQRAVERGAIGIGQVVVAAERPYGLEFARGDNREAFYLVLDDAWHRELRSHAVAL
jgi:hypothetical protein